MMPWARNLLKNDNKETELSSKPFHCKVSVCARKYNACIFLGLNYHNACKTSAYY